MKNIFQKSLLCMVILTRTIAGAQTNSTVDTRLARPVNFISVKTNVLVASRLAMATFPQSFRLAVEKRLDRKRTVRVAAFANEIGLKDQIGGDAYLGARTSLLLFQTAGMQLMLKTYPDAKADQIPGGFYFGPYLNIGYAQRREIRSRSITGSADFRDQAVYYNKVEGKGYLLGLGFNVGYTFNAGMWQIEPALGLGYAVCSKSVYVPRDPNAFIDLGGLENSMIIFGPSFIELQVGRRF